MASEAARPALTEHEVTVRVTELLRDDPVCNGNVNKTTIRAIAQIVAYPEPVINADVAAEREACRALVGRVAARLDALLEGDDPGSEAGAGDTGLITAGELRELRLMLDAQAEMLAQGLHRTGSG